MNATGRAASMLAALAIALVAAGTAAPAFAQTSGKEAAAPEKSFAAVPAAGGQGIFAALPKARAVVAGVPSQPKKIDLHGWSMSLRVDRVLAGRAGVGETLEVAWEELSPSRPVRFSKGERLLLVLESLPTQSLWRKRFPQKDAAARVLVVANRGDAFLRRPDGATLDTFEHWLRLAPDAREGAPGARRLAELVAVAPAGLSGEALDLLATRAELAAQLGPEGADTLLSAARNAGRDPGVRIRVLELAVRGGLPGLRDAATALSQPGSAVRAAAYRALASLPGGLTKEEIAELLEDSEAPVRAAAAAFAADPALRPRLATMATSDSAAEVRIAAAGALLDAYGSDAVEQVIGLLDDEDKRVRGAVAVRIGQLGAPAVPALKRVIDGNSRRAALVAILGLSRAGEEGTKEVFFIANSHEDETLRAAARLALGKAPGHEH